MTYTEPKSPVIQGLLLELQREEISVERAREQLVQAQVSHDVAQRKYAAVRDAIVSLIGQSPYQPNVDWPLPGDRDTLMKARSAKGRARFVRMTVGDALLWALRETDEPQNLQEIVDRLVHGGLPTTPRAVNAALMQTKGIVKYESEGGVAHYGVEQEEEEGDIDPDDLPF